MLQLWSSMLGLQETQPIPLSKNDCSSPPSPIPLPVELLLMVLSYLPQADDLRSLCLTSQILRDVAQPLLYSRFLPSAQDHRGYLEYNFMDVNQLTIIHQTLSSQRIRNSITVLRIYLATWKTCPKRMGQQGRIPPVFRWCTCDKLDGMIGDALENLPYLRDLRLHCFLCPNATAKRHSYLTRLPTQSLQELWFGCTCATGKNNQDLAYGILSAPCARSIEILGLEWNWGQRRIPLKPSLMALLDDPRVLEKVHTLKHGGSVLADAILSKKSVKRLAYQHHLSPVSAYEHGSCLHDSIVQHPGYLTHLMANDPLKGLVSGLKESPEAYRNLRYIGSFYFSYTSFDDIMKAMKPLSVLSCLKMVDIGVEPRFALYPSWKWDEGRLRRLELQHPSLQKVSMAVRASVSGMSQAVLWEKRGIWRVSSVPVMRYWEAVNGGFDKL